MKTIFLSDQKRKIILLKTVLISLLQFIIPVLLAAYIRSLYGAELDYIYKYFAIVVLLSACLPLAVLYFSRSIVKVTGKYGFSLLLTGSLFFLVLFNNSGSEVLLKYQWILTVPLMAGATVYGFFSPHKVILPWLYTPLFYVLAGILGIIDIVNIIKGWLPSCIFLNILQVLFFACLQAGQANILRHRLQREKASDTELKILILNYGLIFTINFCGLLLSTHAMKICLAFMFDNIAAENAVKQKKAFLK